MARRCYCLTLEGVEYKLRLTLAGQKKLMERSPGSTALGCVMSAIDEPEDLAALLTEALNWDGNENTVRDGEEMYDLLVDAGYAGNEAFTELVLDIAHNAGLLSYDDKVKLLRSTSNMLKRNMDRLMASLEEAEQEPVTVVGNEAMEHAEAEPDPLEVYQTL